MMLVGKWLITTQLINFRPSLAIKRTAAVHVVNPCVWQNGLYGGLRRKKLWTFLPSASRLARAQLADVSSAALITTTEEGERPPARTHPGTSRCLRVSYENARRCSLEEEKRGQHLNCLWYFWFHIEHVKCAWITWTIWSKSICLVECVSSG